MKKKLISLAILGASIMATGSCSQENSSKVEYQDCVVSPVDFGERTVLTTKDEIETYHGDTGNDNKPVENGIIMSPYFTLKINNVDVPVYATRTTFAVHSFAYVDIVRADKEKDVELKIEVQSSALKKKFTKVDVLPESNKVGFTFAEKKVEAVVHKTGNYSFVFNEGNKEALTIMIADKADLTSLLENKTKIEIDPGEYYGQTAIDFSAENSVYYFKKGNYRIGTFYIPNNSILYFEEGAYTTLVPDGANAVASNGKVNVGIYGRGIIDFSACNGSQLGTSRDSTPGKGGLNFTQCTNVNIQGLMLINAQTWQCCLNECKNIYIRDCMFYGYRTYADGIMLSDCKDGLVEWNFIRTGDDAFETKSLSNSGLTERVVFQYNSAWTDKACAYGCIYESSHNTSGVRFYNNSVGFAMGTWSPHLGCADIHLGNQPDRRIYDIVFDGLEIYCNYNAGACNVFMGGSGGSGDSAGGIIDDIHFNNVTIKTNMGKVLRMSTTDSEICFIRKIYLENVTSNNIQITKDNFENYVDVSHVAGGYNLRNLYINGEKCN